MGVKDLWQLLAPIGRRVSIETLEGKVLAVDMSIWLTQFIKAMRDDEGNMVKNAHLIGTLRRILKLLYHRIRPVFVFDGKTPLLKERVIRARRKTLEKSESTHRATVHKILLSQLKQHALQQMSSSRSSVPETAQYAAGFRPPQAQASSSSSHPESSSSADADVASSPAFPATDEDDDIQWTEGYENLKVKALDEDVDSAEDDAWDLPQDHSEMSVEVLSSLPFRIRKSIIEDARRKERNRARSSYIPVAENPLLYSQTQLANFINSSKLNKRFQDAHKLIEGNGDDGGKKIAAEGGKKYRLLAQGLRSTSAARPVSSPPRVNTGNASDSSEDEFTSRDWINSSDPTTVRNEERHEEGGQPLKRLKKGHQQPISVDLTADKLQSFHDAPEVEDVAGFYDNLHAADDDEIAWEESEEDADPPPHFSSSPNSAHSTESHGNGGGFLVDEDEGDVRYSPVIEVVLVDDAADELSDPAPNNEVNDTQFGAMKHVLSGNVDIGDDEQEGTKVDSNMLARAVETASKMSNWGGRAVRRVLQGHIKKADVSIVLAPPPPSEESLLSQDQWSQDGGKVVEDRRNEDDDQVSWEQPTEAEEHGIPAHINRNIVTMVDDDHDVPNETEESDDVLRRRRASAARDTERLTEEMKEEVMQLIKAFDLPYIVAPFEAEAQCAVLEQLGLVDGVVTEDSDSFLFGAQAVYKNIFNDKKFVEVYLAEDAKRELGLSRDDLIALAFFLGSDYTEGVHGIGLVNAMEVVQAFSMKAETGGPLAGLNRFKEWLQGYDFAAEVLKHFNERNMLRAENVDKDIDEDELTAAEKKLISFSSKHRNGRAKWSVVDSFPDGRVVQAYMQPDANRNTEPFSWQQPMRHKIGDFCKKVLDWSDNMVVAQVDPVLEQFSARTSQTRIDSHFMTYHDNTRFAKIASDRLRDAVIQITGKETELSLAAPVKTSRKRRKGT